MSSFITDTDIDAMEGEEMSIRIDEVLGLLEIPSGGDWRHAHPRWHRDRLRRLLFPPGPNETRLCDPYHTDLEVALAAASEVGAVVTGEPTDPLVVCRLVLKHALAAAA